MMKKIHIIGICGTFMGGVAKLATELGFEVQGSDQNTYPPMSTQLELLGVTLFSGYDKSHISDKIDLVIVGNTISRGNIELEKVLNNKIPYTSGAQWLAENVLFNRWVLAIAGTHGKTTTSSLLTWILEQCGYQPGFLIGGVPENFGTTARLGNSDFFVIEADEYDTSFSDKRSKFVHYRPNTLVINNLEFDHADIFHSLKEIQTQFHHLIKTLPSNGKVIANGHQKSIQEVLDKGCWSEECFFYYQTNPTSSASHQELSNGYFQAIPKNKSGSKFLITYKNQEYCVEWNLIGEHNLNNAVAAIAAAHHVGVRVEDACKALTTFKSVKRRMELKGVINEIHIYDDFAHHPTAICSSIAGLNATINQDQRMIAVVEARSNTMKMGVHKDSLVNAVKEADYCFFSVPENTTWDTKHLAGDQRLVFRKTSELKEHLLDFCQPGDHILVMSNGGFDGMHDYLLQNL